MVTKGRATVVLVLLGLVAALALPGANGVARTKRLKLGKEGSYVQVFKNKADLWQDDTSVQTFTRGRKVIAVWVTSNYKLDSGKPCWPIGLTGTLLPDQTTMGPVSVQVHPKSPVALTAKNTFVIKATKSNPFYDNGGGSITGRLLPSGKLNVTVKLSQAANSLQARCSTKITAPKAKFKAFKVASNIG